MVEEYSSVFVLKQLYSPKPLKITFEFPLQVANVQCHESNMAFLQQFYFLDKEPFGLDVYEEINPEFMQFSSETPCTLLQLMAR